MISKAGLSVIDTLSTGRQMTPAQLARETEYSQAHLYDVLDELLANGLLTETRGSNNLRRVSLADHPVTEAYRTLRSKLDHVEWIDILSPATLRVCWYLDEPRRVTAIADRLGITRQGVHNALSPLKHRAMLSPSGPEYALSDDLLPVLAFARSLVRHTHRSQARAVAPSATIEWCDPTRSLIRVQTSADTNALLEDPEWRVTGLGRFEEYGLRFLLAGEPTFCYGFDDELTPAEIVCHTLVVDTDSRRISYSMLLIEDLRIDQQALTETAKRYDLELTVDAIYRLLDGDIDCSEESPVLLPSISEYMALKDQYGVA